jgi:mono/diheme cytochrome c family protein
MLKSWWPLVAALAAGAVTTSALAMPAPVSQRRPTFAADIAPIILERCASCHRPGQPAPFSLLSYDDVRAKGKEIAAATHARTMPPWLPVQGPGFPALQNDPRLTDKQIAAIGNWVKNGMPSGDLRKAPAPPSYPVSWPLGTPDLSVDIPRLIAVPGGGPPEGRNIVIPIDYPADLWLGAIDYQRGDAGLVEYAQFFAAPPDLDITDDDALPGVGTLLGRGTLENHVDRIFAAARGLMDLGTWVPSQTRRVMPDRLAMRVPARWHIVVQMHIQPAVVDAAETGRIGLYFAMPLARRAVKPITVPPAFGYASGLSIPAGAAHYVLTDALTLPVAVEAVGARAYAHSLGRQLAMTAQLPDGSTRGLLRIDQWNPAWPDTYYFTAPVKLPQGTSLRVEITYDNSTENPRNLFSPPRRVGWGRTAVGEVGGITLLIASPTAAEAIAIDDALQSHLKEQLMRNSGRTPGAPSISADLYRH